MIKAVIYDMDGLIIDSEPLWQEAEISIFKSVNINLTLKPYISPHRETLNSPIPLLD